jgi:hypothetical protein
LTASTQRAVIHFDQLLEIEANVTIIQSQQVATMNIDPQPFSPMLSL